MRASSQIASCSSEWLANHTGVSVFQGGATDCAGSGGGKSQNRLSERSAGFVRPAQLKPNNASFMLEVDLQNQRGSL